MQLLSSISTSSYFVTTIKTFYMRYNRLEQNFHHELLRVFHFLDLLLCSFDHSIKFGCKMIVNIKYLMQQFIQLKLCNQFNRWMVCICIILFWKCVRWSSSFSIKLKSKRLQPFETLGLRIICHHIHHIRNEFKYIKREKKLWMINEYSHNFAVEQVFT